MADHVRQAQEEKLRKTGEFAFIHHHKIDMECNPQCHAINPTNPKKD
jgi:hypothetical protein